ncbi:MAG: hypothetical protein PGN11_06845 [Quadrisphaera sp.]
MATALGATVRVLPVTPVCVTPPRVHDLHDDRSAGVVDGLGDAAPGVLLLVGGDARLADPALALLDGVGALGDEEAEGRALRVHLGHELTGDAALTGAQARQGRHDDAVGQLEVAEHGGGEEVHGGCQRRDQRHLFQVSTTVAIATDRRRHV